MGNRAVPFQKSLLFNLTAGVLLLGASLLTISLVVTDRAVEKLSGALTNRVIATTDAQIMGFFEPVQSAIEITAERAFGGDFEEFPLETLDRYFVPLIERLPQLSSVMYAHEDGDEYMLLKTGGRWQSRLTRPESWGTWEDWRGWSGQEKQKPIQRRELDYDARRRPWHRGALKMLAEVGEDAPMRERIHWTPPYRFFTTHEPGVTASLAQRTDTGRIVVLGFDILLADISRFTSQLEIGKRGKVFVLRGKPSNPKELVVVGVPADERFADEAAMIRFVLTPPDELGGPVASFVSEALVAHTERPGKAVAFLHKGEPWWGEIARSQIRTSDDIWVGSVIPEEELLEGLPNTSLIIIVTTAVVLLLAILRALWLARRYATPLGELIDHGNRMQRLNFEPVEPVESNIMEIRHLSATLERMRAALQTFSAAREDLRVARSIHRMLLPECLPTLVNLYISGWHEPSEPVGGEFYDAVTLPGAGDEESAGCLLALFEFPGNGVGAAMHGTQLRAALRIGMRDGLDLRALAARLDEFVRTDLSDLGSLRVWLVCIEDGARRLSVLGLGTDALLYRHGRHVERVAAAGGPLGLGPAQEPPCTVELDLADEDTVVLVSAGVLDALDEQRRAYGLAGLQQALREFDHGTAQDLIARVRRDLSRYTSGPRGEYTVLVLQAKRSVRKGDGGLTH